MPQPVRSVTAKPEKLFPFEIIRITPQKDNNMAETFLRVSFSFRKIQEKMTAVIGQR